MPLVVARNSLDLEALTCSQGPTVVAFLDPDCPVCMQYIHVFRAAAKASRNTVFVEAWLPRVADYALRHGIAYAPLTVVYSRCRPLAGIPGALTLEDLRLLLERVVPELLAEEPPRGEGGGEDDNEPRSREDDGG
jgi:thioredoxin-like negative regulator of GroEL